MKTAMWTAAALGLIAMAVPPPAIDAYFGPEEDLTDLICEALREAPEGSTVRVAMFTFTEDSIVEHLTARARDVRLIVDHGQYCGIRSMRDAVDGLRDAGAELRFFCAASFQCEDRHPEGEMRTFFHHKFAVLGDDTVITGSANWTESGAEGGNFENIVILRDDGAARAFRTEFDRLWNLRSDTRIRPPRPGND